MITNTLQLLPVNTQSTINRVKRFEIEFFFCFTLKPNKLRIYEKVFHFLTFYFLFLIDFVVLSVY